MTANGFDPADADAESAAALRQGLGARLRALAEDSAPPPASLRARTLDAALAARRPALVTAEHTACFAGAVSAFDALADELMSARDLGRGGAAGSIGSATGEGWDLVGVLAHLIATDGVLCAAVGLPEAVPLDAAAAGPGDPGGLRTAAVLDRLRGTGAAHMREVWRRQAHSLLREPGDPAAVVAVGGVTLSRADCHADRAFETWVHTCDLTSRHGLPEVAPARVDQLIAYGVRALRTALAEQAVAPLRLTLTGRAAGTWLLPGDEGDDERDGPHGRHAPHGPETEVVADSLEFCRLVGGRRTAETVRASIRGGDPSAGRALLATAARFARL